MSVTFFSRKKEYQSLSNFWERPVILDEVRYYSGEVCFQAQKFIKVAEASHGARKRDLIEWARKISVKTDATLARKMGRQFVLTPEELQVWNRASIQVQTRICRYKFENEEEVRADLRKSGDKILIHPCRCNDEAIKSRIWEGRLIGDVVVGGNMLGKIWMEFRSFL
jgi:ribA/ribD-fused uncharacterized protein